MRGESLGITKLETTSSNIPPISNQCNFLMLCVRNQQGGGVQILITLNISCPFKANLMVFGLISQRTSRPRVPFGTCTSIKTSSIVCAQFPQGVLQGTTPLFSSKWAAILLLQFFRCTIALLLVGAVFIKITAEEYLVNWRLIIVLMRSGARVWCSSAANLRLILLHNIKLRFRRRGYCQEITEMSVSCNLWSWFVRINCDFVSTIRRPHLKQAPQL